ncbi:hypothetical protein GGR53DRAFT_501760 [Hypoxylon sp. FL1150]|nr:hypothetical protein GGR53DRAFT_501760 [Hypoxylon sp. FL1150]
MQSFTPRRAARALKRALTRSISSRLSLSRRSPTPRFSQAKAPTVSVSSVIQEGLHNFPSLLLNLLKKFLELNQHLYPIYYLRDPDPAVIGGLTSSYSLISSTTSLLPASRVLLNPAIAASWEAEASGAIPLVSLSAPSARGSSDTMRSNPFRDSNCISRPSSSISTWASS